MPLFLYEVPPTSVWLKYKWFVQPKLHRDFFFWHSLPRHVLFQHGWGDCMVVFLDVFIFNFERTETQDVVSLPSSSSFAMFF